MPHRLSPLAAAAPRSLPLLHCSCSVRPCGSALRLCFSCVCALPGREITLREHACCCRRFFLSFFFCLALPALCPVSKSSSAASAVEPASARTAAAPPSSVRGVGRAGRAAGQLQPCRHHRLAADARRRSHRCCLCAAQTVADKQEQSRRELSQLLDDAQAAFSVDIDAAVLRQLQRVSRLLLLRCDAHSAATFDRARDAAICLLSLPTVQREDKRRQALMADDGEQQQPPPSSSLLDLSDLRKLYAKSLQRAASQVAAAGRSLSQRVREQSRLRLTEPAPA